MNTNNVFNQPMRLVYVPSNEEVVRFPEGLDGKAEFSSNYAHIAEAMKTVGIPIPTNKKNEYSLNSDRVSIRLEDPKFGRAFHDLYFSETMDPAKFRWEPLSP